MAEPVSGASGEPTIREQLIAGTIRLIDTEGLGDLSVRHLATSSGRSTMCLYTKFGNRQGLLEAVHQHLGQELLERLDTSDPVAALAEYAQTFRNRYTFLIGIDPDLLGLAPTMRSDLLAPLVRALGDGDPDQGAERLAWVHGRVLLSGAFE